MNDEAHIDLTHMRIPSLLALESRVVDELLRRDLVRTRNKPLGDIAERVVQRARGGALEPSSTKSYDLRTDAGERIQVKSMGARNASRSAKFSPFRTFDFDVAIFLVFAPQTFSLALAREISVADVDAMGRYSRHVNGKAVTLRQVSGAGRDVTEEMRAAYDSLEAPDARG